MKSTKYFSPRYISSLTFSIPISFLGLHLSLYKLQMSKFITVSHATFLWELANLCVHKASEYKRPSNGSISTRDQQSDNHRLYCQQNNVAMLVHVVPHNKHKYVCLKYGMKVHNEDATVVI
jgi:hypothetical protein